MEEHSREYRTIEALILRNDFATAGNLLKKRALPPREREALSALLEQRRRTRQRDRDRTHRRRRLERWLSRFNFGAFKWFLGIYLVVGFIVTPYDALNSGSFRARFGRRGAILMEALNALSWVILAVWLLFLYLEERSRPPQRRDKYRQRDLALGVLGLLAMAILQLFLMWKTFW